ncbi:hypothetical protein VSR71_20855 [Cupriavidus oxalaticus]
MYLAGPDIKVDDTRRRVLNLLEDRIKTLRPFAVANPNEEESADPELDAIDPLKGFGTQNNENVSRKQRKAQSLPTTRAKGLIANESRIFHVDTTSSSQRGGQRCTLKSKERQATFHNFS